MQQIWSTLLLVVCTLAWLSASANAAYSYQCPNGGCVGPLVLVFNGAACEGEATAHPLYDVSRYPNLGENVCLSSSSRSQRYTCGNEEYREKLWKSSTDCSGDPLEERLLLTHMCARESMPGSPDVYSMIICGPNDVNTPIIPSTNSLPRASDPVLPSAMTCPNNTCRPDYASYIRYNESTTCNGPSVAKEASRGELGQCYRRTDAPSSKMTICDEKVLREFTYAGSCLDLAIGYTDTFRGPSTCTVMDTNQPTSRTEIYCPTVSPTFPVPLARPPTGNATSLTLPVLLAFLLLAVTASVSF